MPDTPPSDEELDRVLASLDPLDRRVLFANGVKSARDAVGSAISYEIGLDVRRGGTTGEGIVRARRPRQLSGVHGRRLVPLSVGVAALAAAVLIVSALLPSGRTGGAQLGPTPASAAVALDQAARVTARQTSVPLTANQYTYVAVREGFTTSAGIDSVGVNLSESDAAQF